MADPKTQQQPPAQPKPPRIPGPCQGRVYLHFNIVRPCQLGRGHPGPCDIVGER